MMDRLIQFVTTRHGMLVVLCLMVSAIVVMLWRRSRNAESKINLDDLLLGDDGKMSKAACVFLGAFLLTSWQLVYMTMQGKWTEGYSVIFVGAWITPIVARIIKGPAA